MDIYGLSNKNATHMISVEDIYHFNDSTSYGKDEPICIPLDVFPPLTQTLTIAFMSHLGFSLQAGAHIGNLLGANKPSRARISSYVLLVFVFMLATAESIALMLYRNYWGTLFTNSEVITRAIARIMPLACTFMIADAIGSSSLGCILRGAGKY